MAPIDYFQLLEIPFSLHPDSALVRKNFYRLSKQYHPDRFTTAPPDAQQEALQTTAALNQAFKTFNNKDLLLGYVLRQEGIVVEEEQYTLPPDFLMEMLELNEAVSDYEFSEGDAKVKEAVVEEWQRHAEALENTLPDVQDKGDLQTQAAALKGYYYRKKYLLRIKERIDTFAAHPD